VFFIVRAVLALFPVLALRYPIKKWAAMVALAAATFYLVPLAPRWRRSAHTS
jgi:competence protein ComEC